MNKKISLGVAIALMAIVCAVTFLLTSTFTLQSFNAKYNDTKVTAKRFEKLQELDELINQNYYAAIKSEDLIDTSAIGYLNGLGDRFSYYRTQKQVNEAGDAARASLSTIGITVKEDEKGYIRVLDVVSDTQASGILRIGDLIVSVDGEDVVEIGYKEALYKMRLKLYDGVDLKIRRNNVDEIHYFVNKTLENDPAVSSEMVTQTIGYAKILHFDDGAGDQFRLSVENLRDLGVEKLIIDLRDNTGGIVGEAEKALDALLPEGDYAKAIYKDGREEIIVRSDDYEIEFQEIVILVNGKTASSAELVAAVLKDYKDAKLVGVKTFGKGIMQKEFVPKHGGLLTLTVATIRTLKTPTYNAVGMLPDVEVALQSDLGIKFEPGGTEEDLQFNKAVDMLSPINP